LLPLYELPSFENSIFQGFYITSKRMYLFGHLGETFEIQRTKNDYLTSRSFLYFAMTHSLMFELA